MNKFITPINFIVFVVVTTGIVSSVYAEAPKERITNSVGMEFVLIIPGTFMMESPEEEPGRYTGEIPHAVNLTHPFYMQTTEVRQAQWLALMGDNLSRHKRCGERCPVEQVAWEEAQRFIQQLDQKEGTEKYRLPSEAEWEYACRAGGPTALSSGSDTTLQCDIDDNLIAIGWYCGNSQDLVHPVAGKNPNPGGLCDMLGNVQEWCQDGFGGYPNDEAVNPKGPKEGACRVMRGGDVVSSGPRCPVCEPLWAAAALSVGPYWISYL